MIAVEHAKARVVGVHQEGAEHAVRDHLRDRTNHVRGECEPVAQCRGGNVHVASSVNVGLPVERLGVLTLADDDVGQQTRPWQSTIHDLLALCDHYAGLAVWAGYLLEFLGHELEVSGHELKRLGRGEADCLLLCATIQAGA